MGCGSSSASDPSGTGPYEDDDDFTLECSQKRRQYNHKTGEADECADGVRDCEDMENPLFEEQDETAQEFMAVRPWIGAVKEPDNHNEVNKDKPDEQYALEYVYGYRCADSRQNVHYNSDGKAVYMTAALGVILDHDANEQTFFGGGEVETTHKVDANDTDHHTDDIMSIALSSDRSTAVSGQVGRSPAIFTWDACTGEKKQRFKLAKGARGVSAVAMSADGSFIACADLHNDHNVYVFDASNGSMVLKQKGGPDKIYDICFSQESGSTLFATGGRKHFYVWDAAEAGGRKKRGIFGDYASTSMSCVCWDADGKIYGGGANSKIYVFLAEDRCVQQTIDCHKGGFIASIRHCDGKIYSGAKDGFVCEIDTTSMTCLRSFDFGNPVRAVDFFNGNLLVGLRNGTIVHVNADADERKEIMHSHCDGEVWGLQVRGTEVTTTGDDNQIIVWDTEGKCRSKVMPVTDRKEGSRRGGASTLSNLSPSQCSRAVVSNDNFIIAAGNDGAVNIYEIGGEGPPQVLTDSTEWIEVMKFSPDGRFLAVGSHDNNIYIYDAQEGFTHIGTLDKHNSFIVAFDWCQESRYIRSNCGAHELLFFTVPECQQDPDGASNTTATEWASKSVKFSWHVDGIFPKYADGTHVNGVCGSSDGVLIATGDDYGLVNVFRDPVRNGGKPRSYRGHSEHVVRVAFNEGNDKIFSVGGYDQTLMQWKKC